jgi:hypothetical protein
MTEKERQTFFTRPGFMQLASATSCIRNPDKLRNLITE